MDNKAKDRSIKIISKHISKLAMKIIIKDKDRKVIFLKVNLCTIITLMFVYKVSQILIYHRILQIIQEIYNEILIKLVKSHNQNTLLKISL